MSELKTIRVIPFSGKSEDWNRWSKTFLATATVKGYREVLKPSDPTKKANPELNVQVYNDLILSCQEDITFGIVDESISTDYPDGDARLAWNKLKINLNQVPVLQSAAKERISHVETNQC